MSKTSDFITEYLEITGRPAASLSVEEYLKFVSLCSPQPQHIAPVFPTAENLPSEEENNVNKTEKISQQIKNPLPTQTKIQSFKPDNTTVKKSTNALSVLQSIPG